MSASINGASISLTRGDSLILNVNVTVNGELYTPEAGDVIRFAMKTSTNADEVLINKNVDLSTMTLRIEPSDTKSLSFGTYTYDLELTTHDGYVDTFIGPASFTITPEVL